VQERTAASEIADDKNRPLDLLPLKPGEQDVINEQPESSGARHPSHAEDKHHEDARTMPVDAKVRVADRKE